MIMIPKPPGRSPRGVEVNTLECNIIVREFELQSRYYAHFQTSFLGKVWTPLIPQLWVKYYHCSSSKRIAVALNNPRRLICH